MKWRFNESDNIFISDDRNDVDVEMVYQYLSGEAYWSLGIPRETLIASLDGSLCFSLYEDARQIGFARVLSDFATIAYLGDVFVLPDCRKNGYGKWLVECVCDHHKLQGLRRWILATSDAHGLYEQYQFKALAKPEIFMERHDQDAYSKNRKS